MVAQDVHGVLPVPAGAAVVLEAGLEAEWPRVTQESTPTTKPGFFYSCKAFIGKQIGGKCHLVLDSVSNV